MKKPSVVWLIIIVVVIVLGVWYWSSTMGYSGSTNTNANGANQSSSPGTMAISTTTSTPATEIVLDVASTTKLGTYLVAANGMTLYKYTEDQPGVSNCTGQCAVVWPPYTIPASEASSSLGGGSGISGQVGIITRPDGTLQITYNSIPLYFYDKDQKVGDTTGQDVGGVWFVVSP